MTLDGPLGLLIELGFVACLIALLVFLVQQFRRTGRDDWARASSGARARSDGGRSSAGPPRGGAGTGAPAAGGHGY